MPSNWQEFDQSQQDADALSVCKKCRCQYLDEEGSDEYSTGLCYQCFEEGVEEYEIQRRERIARQNEY